MNSRRIALRLPLLVLIGLAAIGISMGVRNSRWAQERRLRELSVEELALAVHDSPNDALTWVYYGSALLKSGNANTALYALQRAVRLNPNLADARRELGNAQATAHDMKAANQSFQEAVRLDPKDPRNYLALAKTYYIGGSNREAIEPLKKLVALEPNNAYAWHTLGVVYGNAHESDLAYDALKKAVSLDPKQALCWRDLAQVSRHYSRFQEAEQQFQKSLALDASDATAHYLLGQMYLQMGDTPQLQAQAQEQLEATARLDPKLGQAQFELGRLYERKGDYQRAVTCLRKATSLNPADNQALYHLGLCLVKTGHEAQGKPLIAGAQELAKASHDIEDTENRIKFDPQNRSLHLRLARLFRKYENDEGAMAEYKIYARMGMGDAAVRREVEQYQTELKRNSAAVQVKTKSAENSQPPAFAPSHP